MASDYAQLKKQGFLLQRQDETFSLRIKVTGGNLPAGQLPVLAALADECGRGYVHLTSRQSVEIPFIRLEHTGRVLERLREAGISTAALGPTVRTVTACQGAAVCRHGHLETGRLAELLEREFGGAELPHKFKFAVTGCRNNCAKAEENDFGVMGALAPAWLRPDDCVFCGLCAKICPGGAIEVDEDQKTLSYDAGACVFCGRCAQRCPKQAWSGRAGHLIYFGGWFGNSPSLGFRLFPVADEADVLEIARRTLDFFKAHAQKGERLGRTIVRLGRPFFEDFMLNP